MKWMQRVAIALGGVLFLLSLLIVLCGLNPGLADTLGNILYAGTTDEQQDVELANNGSEGRGQGDAALLSKEKDPSSMEEDSITMSSATEGTQGESADTESSLAGALEDMQQSGSNVGTYEPPADENIQPEAELTERTGYQPIQESGSQIEEPEAARLEKELGVGETGEELTFDSIFYPYYAMLDDTGKSLYKQIYANAIQQTEAFAPVADGSGRQLMNAFTAVYNDHPELFYVDTAYAYKYSRNGKIAEIDLQFNSTADTLEDSQAAFDGAVNKIVAEAENLGSDYEKEVYVHDALLSLIEYDLRAPLSQSAYSALVNGRTVCAGYARAFQYIMQKLSIPCYYCTGYAGENHAWNIVRLEDGFYNVDTTWDDTEPNTYRYFNCSDIDYANNHKRTDLSVYLPACNGEMYRGLLSDDGQTDGTFKGALNNGITNGGQTNQAQLVTLAEVGFTEEDVLHSMDDYYDDCYSQAVQADSSPVVFYNVITGMDMWKQLYSAYQGNGYQDGYVKQVLADTNASSCSVQVDGQELQGGYYLLKHTMTLR